MPTNTIRLHRVVRAPPEKVYRAFLDAGALAKWLPPNGFTGKGHHLDAKVGGTHKMSFTDFTTGHNRMELQAAIAALWQRLKRIAKSSSSSVPAGRDPSASQASPL